ncbi:MAG: amidohydrolase family protein [bacterium]
MVRQTRKFEIIDAHTHFFSYTWLEHFQQLARSHGTHLDSVEALAQKLSWEAPPQAPDELGKKWVEEQDQYGVRRQVLFASKLNDAEFLSAAVQAYPDRLIGYVLIDPKQKNAREQTLYSLNILNMKGILLFPAMHHFHVSDKKLVTLYEEAAAAEVPVFIHFGQLKIPIYEKLGLPENIKQEYAQPGDLKKTAREFPEVNFIIPHFGCGLFEEALQLASEFPNIYFDTASSNSWIQPPLTLKEVFQQSLQTLGAQRLLFGTDSSSFPRGWRNDIYETQLQILESLQISSREKAEIFGGNIARILKLA